MKHLTILVPDAQVSLNTFTCIIGAYDIFKRANEFWKENGKEQLFKIQLAGVSEKTEINNGLLTLKPETNISSIKETDLVIIPAISHDFNQPEKGNIQLIDWIEKQYKNGAEVASMCSGALILASTRLLDGKSCSIHWNTADKLKRLFPKVIVKTDRLITDEHGIYTNGGGYSFLNLILYLIEKYYDRETAIYCSKIYQIEIDRQRQSEFTIFKGQKAHGDDIIEKAQVYIEENFQEKISMEELSQKLAVGRRNFDRRFIKATGNTPVEYLQRVKIESAKKAFETTRKNINEVMFEVGYADEKAFREIFKKITGMSPLEYKKKYNKKAMSEY
ncbi:helix-turn-helix domain-containing protein [Flavobacterium alkalisoli]|uniref:Helix-turn-helix domain-containing protein n=1 Tax=Flavobacterium alkalisoli TaxID=2602769 RepID=A0A5B9G144_9FLAO|nr:helix-turn-helix domain-containing protein [Flavobacterium alkalisoli]QEE51172.1 helix-turn-helix domain-containing protein [Flavobacterium alkalisoli]